MNKTPHQQPEKSKLSTYKITVNGALPEDWADWFNGMLIDIEHPKGINPQTILTCKIRDQAELNGILNWLHSMNLRLVKVVQCSETDDRRKDR